MATPEQAKQYKALAFELEALRGKLDKKDAEVFGILPDLLDAATERQAIYEQALDVFTKLDSLAKEAKLEKPIRKGFEVPGFDGIHSVANYVPVFFELYRRWAVDGAPLDLEAMQLTGGVYPPHGPDHMETTPDGAQYTALVLRNGRRLPVGKKAK